MFVVLHRLSLNSDLIVNGNCPSFDIIIDYGDVLNNLHNMVNAGKLSGYTDLKTPIKHS